MLHALRHMSVSTRTALLVFLVLGALLRSGITLAAELHALGHQTHAMALDHAYGHEHEEHEHKAPASGESGHDNAEAFHGLLHQCSGVHFAALFAVDSALTLPAVAPMYFFKPDDFASASLATPFRPPIA